MRNSGRPQIQRTVQAAFLWMKFAASAQNKVVILFFRAADCSRWNAILFITSLFAGIECHG
jgi:hypothetical protein